MTLENFGVETKVIRIDISMPNQAQKVYTEYNIEPRKSTKLCTMVGEEGYKAY